MTLAQNINTLQRQAFSASEALNKPTLSLAWHGGLIQEELERCLYFSLYGEIDHSQPTDWVHKEILEGQMWLDLMKKRQDPLAKANKDWYFLSTQQKERLQEVWNDITRCETLNEILAEMNWLVYTFVDICYEQGLFRKF